MGVYIKMEMPRSCYECRFNNGSMCYALRNDNDYILNENTDIKRHSNCPLVQIKTPHGRLIDADVMQREGYQKNFEGIISNWALFNLNYYLEEKAQIILEAEEK